MEVFAVQMDIVWEDRLANHAKAAALLEAADVPADSLIVLPEMFDCGFTMHAAQVAQSKQHESEAFLAQLAKQHRCTVLGGVVGPLVGTHASNEAVAFDASGSLLCRYRKQKPFTLAGEHTHYGAGDRHERFTHLGMSISPFICYDLRFPEVFRPAALAGAELLVVIASWPAVRSEHWVRLLQARAIENQAYAIGVNRCGTDPNLPYDGRSVAFSPLGESLGEADGAEQVMHWTIDAEAVRQWRRQFPALDDAHVQH
ncbi:MAG: hypothetical protein KDB14_04345 [Planctomycetales bacterium]|nr:hypothetical protein [Planctomycetales bacterium]